MLCKVSIVALLTAAALGIHKDASAKVYETTGTLPANFWQMTRPSQFPYPCRYHGPQAGGAVCREIVVGGIPAGRLFAFQCAATCS